MNSFQNFYKIWKKKFHKDFSQDSFKNSSMESWLNFLQNRRNRSMGKYIGFPSTFWLKQYLLGDFYVFFWNLFSWSVTPRTWTEITPNVQLRVLYIFLNHLKHWFSFIHCKTLLVVFSCDILRNSFRNRSWQLFQL